MYIWDPNISEVTRAGKSKLKIQLEMVMYSLWAQKFPLCGVQGAQGPLM